MESIESKLDRLSPGQRKEVEDFVDFLISRSGSFQETPVAQPQIRNAAPPALIMQEPVHVMKTPPLKENDMTGPENTSIPAIREEKTAPPEDIAPAGDDRITCDYMDYGQFDRTPSPATAAVKKVKEKLQKHAENEKPSVSLDWID
jgi:hypothetical protein